MSDEKFKEETFYIRHHEYIIIFSEFKTFSKILFVPSNSINIDKDKKNIILPFTHFIPSINTQINLFQSSIAETNGAVEAVRRNLL